MRLKRKGTSKALNIVIDMVILAVVAVIIIMILKGSALNFFKGLHDCENTYHGTCMRSCGEYPHEPAGDPWCEQKNKDLPICCKTGRSGISSEETGIGAHSELMSIIITDADKLDQTLNHGDSITLETGITYFINFNMKDIRKNLAIDTEKLGSVPVYCKIWLSERDDSYGTNEFSLDYLNKQETSKKKLLEYATTTYPITKSVDENNINKEGSLIRVCSLPKNKKDLILNTRMITPTQLDANKKYSLNVAVLNETLSELIDKQKDKNDLSEIYYELSDDDYWKLHFLTFFDVKQEIEINGLSTTYVPEEEITIKTRNNFILNKVNVAVVSEEEVNKNADTKKLSEKASSNEKIYSMCASLGTNRYTDSLYKITNVKTGKRGFSFLSIGKDNYPYAQYDAQIESIKIENDNLAKIHLDAASFIYGAMGLAPEYETSGHLEELKEETLISKQALAGMIKETKFVMKYYLCVKAEVSRKKSADTKEIISYSTQPLMIDIAPPTIGNSDNFIKVNYPKPYKKKIQELQKIGIREALQNFYFQEYPYIEITEECLDKSGCKHFDYYFAPTQIGININLKTNETGSGVESTIFSAILSEGLNLLYDAILKSNPLDTVCPLADSGRYRANDNNKIRFQGEQGIFCIKVMDGVGNYWLTWKSVYNPYSILSKLGDKLINDKTDSGMIVPNIG